jgi:hypothetical protein
MYRLGYPEALSGAAEMGNPCTSMAVRPVQKRAPTLKLKEITSTAVRCSDSLQEYFLSSTPVQLWLADSRLGSLERATDQEHETQNKTYVDTLMMGKRAGFKKQLVSNFGPEAWHSRFIQNGVVEPRRT